MKKVFISAMLLCAATFGYAQLNVASVEKVALPQGVTANKATISPDGSYVVLSQYQKEGLHKLDLATKNVTMIAENGSATDLLISEDGSQVIFREISYDKGLRKAALKSMNLATGKQATLVKATRNLQGFAVKGATVLAMNKGKLAAKSITGGSKDLTAPVASIDGGQLFVTVNGQTKNISPQGTYGQSYLWPSVSPDGTKVVYYLARSGAYVCNIDGSNPVFLGGIRAPRWYDNNTVVGMNDEDNGEFVTASKIVAVSADGKMGQNLTEDASMAMFPSVSADGSKIAYSTPAGELYIINISK